MPHCERKQTSRADEGRGERPRRRAKRSKDSKDVAGCHHWRDVGVRSERGWQSWCSQGTGALERFAGLQATKRGRRAERAPATPRRHAHVTVGTVRGAFRASEEGLASQGAMPCSAAMAAASASI